MKKKGAIKPWAAILLTFAGILGVIGATILTLFFMGKLNQTVIKPEDIDFVQELDEGDGLGFFDASTSTFSVSSNFKMTITSSTEDVTARNVTLSLSNAGKPDANGYISNNIIKIPQNVLLNRPFDVELLRDQNGFVRGGNCTITAKSENVMAQNKTIQIAVDVPVSSIQVGVKDGNTILAGAVQEVVTGTKFTVDTLFTPQNSRYMFSNALQSKKVFYTNSSSMFISYDEKTGVFTANQRSTTPTQVSAYVFANSFYETKFLKEFNVTYPNASAQKLTEEAMAYFAKNPTHAVSETIAINVVDVVVDNVSFAHVSAMDKNMQVDKYYTLKANSMSGNSLGATIKAGGVERRSLMGNVGIKVPKGISAFNIIGGQVIKVEKLEGGTKITREAYDENFNYAAAEENVEYYILPNNSPVDYGDYFWKFSCTEVLSKVDLDLNFFSEKENGVWENFDAFGQEKSFSMAVKANDLEDSPSWIEDSISLQITFSEGENGEAVTNKATKELSKYLNVNEKNTYKTVRYFLMTDGFNGALTEYFNCQEAKTYQTTFGGSNIDFSGFTMPNGGWQLYEVSDPDGLLVANKAISRQTGRVYAVAATVKTDVNDNLDMDGDRYKIIKVSGAKQIQVTSALSIVNMKPTFKVDSDINVITENAGATNETKKYYIPAINFDKTTTQAKNVLSFSLTLNKHGEDDGSKLLEAFEKDIKLICRDNEGVCKYLTLLTPTTISSEDDTTVVINSEIEIDTDLFKAERGEKTFTLSLAFDGKEKQLTDINKISNELTVYYQTPKTYYGAYEDEFPSTILMDGQQVLLPYVKVVNTSESLSINWENIPLTIEPSGQREVDGLDELNDRYLNFTLLDQHGRKIDPRVYSVQFVEEAYVDGHFKEAVTRYLDFGQNKINNFPGTTGTGEKPTYLAVYIVDVNNNDSRVTDAYGNELTFPKVKFNIDSKGITKIEQNTDTNMADFNNYASFGSTSNAAVSKIIEPGTSIDMTKLIKVYTSNNTAPVDPERLVFHLAKTSASNSELANMIFINGNTNKPILADYTENNPITSISFAGVFGGNGYTINFVVTDQKRTFQIDLAFNCLPATNIDNEFAAFAQTQSLLQKEDGTYYTYGDLMRKDARNENTPVLFANHSYDLDTVLPLSNGYKWSGLGRLQTQAEGVTINGSTLVLGKYYKCTAITITVYYAVESTLAPYKEVTLYINPNILVKENVAALNTDPMFNLHKADTNFGDLFKFYLATDVLESGKFDRELAEISGSEYNTKFASSAGYLSVENFAFKVKSGTLELELGKAYTQNFNMLHGDDIMDASVVRVADGKAKVIEQTGTKGAVLSVSMGFGTDEANTIQAIFKGRLISKEESADADEEIENILTGTFNIDGQQKTYALLSAGEKYQLNEGFTVHKVQGQISQNMGNLMAGRGFSSILYTQDSCTIRHDVEDLTVLIVVPCMISRFGDKFVQYGTFDDSGNFVSYGVNVYQDLTLQQLTDLNVLEEKDVYQLLDAGEKYQILHNGRYGSNDNGAGFYYNSYVLGSGTVDVSIVKSYYGANKTNKNFASIITDNGLKYLQINPISSEYKDVYLVLSATVTFERSSYTYYYRVKVNSTFNATDVLYPYDITGTNNQARAEYLDANSIYYKDGTYCINLEEELNGQNSRYPLLSSKRFGDLTDLSGKALADVTKEYRLYSINGSTNFNASTYFTTCEIKNLENGKKPTLLAQLKNQNEKVSVVVECIYKINGVKAIGGELYYTFAFNMGETYTSSLSNTAEGNGVTTYNASLVAGGIEATFDGNITYTKQSATGTVTSEEKVFGIQFVSGATNALREIAVAAKDITLDDGTQIKAGQPIGAWDENITNTALIEGKDYYYTYGYLDGKTLHVKPLTDVEKDQIVEIRFFTDQRVAFTLRLKVEGYYNWTINQKLEKQEDGTLVLAGNTTYTLGDTSGNFIFEDIAGTDTVRVDNVEITLTNGDTVYQTGTTYNDLVKIDTATDWKNTKIRFAHLYNGSATFNFNVTINRTENSAGYSFVLSVFVAQSYIIGDGISKDSGLTFVGGQEISLNAADYAVGNIEDGKGYKFVFKQIVLDTNGKPVLDENNNSTYQYVDAAKFNAEVVGEKDGKKVSKDLTLAYVYYENDTDIAPAKELFTVPLTYLYTAMPNVKLAVNYPSPDGKNMLDYEYVTATKQNGVFVSDDFNLSHVAPFAAEASLDTIAKDSYQRLAVEKVKFKNIDGVETTIEDKDISWTIDIESIQGVTVVHGSDEASEQTKDFVTKKPGSSIASTYFKFKLAENTTNGSVTFKITVNKVEAYYTVRVTNQPIVKYVQNSPNYGGEGTNKSETIYAEDLVGKEMTIFAASRILKYSLKNQELVGKTLHIKLTQGTQTKTFDILAQSGTINYDLGESMQGYKYAGTYTGTTVDANGQTTVDEKTKLVDDDNFTITPYLTERVEAQYADGTKIKLFDFDNHNVSDLTGTRLKNILYIANAKEDEKTGEPIDVNANNVALPGTVGTTNYKLYFKTAAYQLPNTSSHLTTSSIDFKDISDFIYNVSLKLDFNVMYNADNVADSNGVVSLPRAVDLQAKTLKIPETAVSLLSEQVAGKTAGFGITRMRDDSVYTKKMLEDSGARLSLAIYGFKEGGMAIQNSTTDSLMQAAYYLHNDLINTPRTSPTGNEVKYITGLLPRAADINGNNFTPYNESDARNGIDGSDGTYNYISAAGNIEGSTYATDWNLYAQGAANDGNYVLMKLTYSIDLGSGNKAETSHNILFRVLPNSTIDFYRRSGTQALTTQLLDKGKNVSVATNVNDQYIIEDDSFTAENGKAHTVDLFKKNTETNVLSGAIFAKMRGDNVTNTADQFKFTYTVKPVEAASADKTSYGNYQDITIGDDLAYNNYINFNNDLLNATDWGWTKNITNGNIVYSKDFKVLEGDSPKDKLLLTFNDKLDLGERHFFVEFEDLYGYKGRFYITLVSGNNPQVDSISGSTPVNNTLIEGKGLVFGAKFNTVSSTTGTARYNQFTYSVKSGLDGKNDGDYNDVIRIINKGNSLFNITQATLTATLISDKKSTEKDKDGNDVILVKAGESIKKTVENPTDITISGGDWKLLNNTAVSDVSQLDLAGANIVLELTLKSKAGEGKTNSIVGTYTAEYGTKNGDTFTRATDADEKDIGTLTQNYTVGASNMPEYGDSDGQYNITLRGIKAYGFANSMVAVDESSIENYYSDINNIAVKQVEFFYQGNSIGKAKADTSSVRANLITNEDYSFINKKDNAITVRNGNDNHYSIGIGETIEGIVIDNLIDLFKLNFKVPHIDGSLYGTGTTLSNVSMVVTVMGTVGNSTDVEVKLAPYTVTLQRELEVGDKDTPVVLDNTTAQAPSINPAGADVEIYNDTLEVTLQPYESVSFAITDLDSIASATYNENNKTITFNGKISKTETAEDGTVTTTEEDATKTEKVITLTAGGYAVTKYVGMLASISNLQKNDDVKPIVYLVGHTKNSGKDNIAATETHNFKYNGNKLTFTEQKILQRIKALNETDEDVVSANGQINHKASVYNPITLHIHNTAELTSKTRPETLYYLIHYKHAGFDLQGQPVAADDGLWYQHQQKYTVSTIYTKAEATSLVEGAIIVDDYLKVENQVDKKAFYVIALDQWAKDIKLVKGKGEDDDTLGEVNNADYQFKFSIGQGGGTAFIDQHGLITTSDDFTIGPGIIFVDVDIKVSGQDGNFEDDVNTVRLGSFAIRLRNNTNVTEITRSDDEVKNGGVYKYKQSIVTIPQNYKAYSVKSPTSIETVSLTLFTNNETVNVNTTLSATCDLNNPLNNKPFVFKDIFGGTKQDIIDKAILYNKDDVTKSVINKDLSYNNITYHRVAIKKGENTTYINFNNNKQYTFSEPGHFTLTFVLDARQNGTFIKRMFNIDILVYDNSSTAQRESVRVAIATGTDYTLSTATDETWWEVKKDATATKLNEPKISFADAAKHEKTYIVAQANGNYKYVDATIFAYTNTRYISVALGAGNTLDMLKLDGNLIRFYSYDTTNGTVGETEIKSQVFQSSAAGVIFDRDYIAIDKDGKAVRVVVNYKIISTTVEKQPSAYVPITIVEDKQVFAKGDILSQIKETLGLKNALLQEITSTNDGENLNEQGSFILVQVRNGNVLTVLDNVEKLADAYRQSLDLVVTYRTYKQDGVTLNDIQVVTMRLTMYSYNSAATLTPDNISKIKDTVNGAGEKQVDIIDEVGTDGTSYTLTFIGGDNSRYPLSTLNSSIIAIVNAGRAEDNQIDTSATVSYWKYNVRQTQVKLTEDLPQETYYIQVDTANGSESEYYLFKITLNWRDAA